MTPNATELDAKLKKQRFAFLNGQVNISREQTGESA